jgi:hypothetical protein
MAYPGITAIIAVDAEIGQEVWKFYPACASNTACPFLPVYSGGVLVSTSYVGGNASWGNAISYSKSQKLLFFGTGQNTHSVGLGGANTSISNEMIYTSSGFVGPGVVGLFGIGLK